MCGTLFTVSVFSNDMGLRRRGNVTLAESLYRILCEETGKFSRTLSPNSPPVESSFPIRRRGIRLWTLRKARIFEQTATDTHYYLTLRDLIDVLQVAYILYSDQVMTSFLAYHSDASSLIL